ncbi:MAG: hypothetical protein ACK2VD_10275, partial [Anaerolineae bacterium]
AVEWPPTAAVAVEPAPAPAALSIVPSLVLLADDEASLVGAVARQLRRASALVRWATCRTFPVPQQ